MLVGVGVLAASSSFQLGASATSKPTVATAPFATPSGVTLATTPPPWPLPADAKPYIATAGLSVLARSNSRCHYHAHLGIIANGKKVTVPAGIGFVIEQGKATGITVLHTHDPSGIVHIESASDETFTLGQLFTEWGVASTPAKSAVSRSTTPTCSRRTSTAAAGKGIPRPSDSSPT